jgi:hypothetical protein
VKFQPPSSAEERNFKRGMSSLLSTLNSLRAATTVLVVVAVLVVCIAVVSSGLSLQKAKPKQLITAVHPASHGRGTRLLSNTPPPVFCRGRL